MSIIQPQSRTLQQFYRSGPMPCPYLPGRIERKLFTRLAGPQADDVNSTLSRAGFRRSHDIVYRPVCPGCAECVPVRILAQEFVPSRGFRRILRRNADLSVTEIPALASPEQFRLFTIYQHSRHGDSDMARMSFLDYTAMVEDGKVNTTHMLVFRDPEQRLRAIMLMDHLADGFSAVYSFYDPNEESRSLGSYMVLALIERARARNLPHVYLGYWINDSRKMSYKARFRPLEVLGHDGWCPLRLEG